MTLPKTPPRLKHELQILYNIHTKIGHFGHKKKEGEYTIIKHNIHTFFTFFT